MFLAVTIASGVTTYTNLFIIIINEGLLLRGTEGKRMGTAKEGKEIPKVKVSGINTGSETSETLL